MTESSTIEGVNKWLPLMQWLLMIAIAISGIGLYFRDTSAAQSSEIKDLQKIALEAKEERREIKSNSVSREVFEIRMTALEKELEKQRNISERIYSKVK